jgi:hypothetical protein
MDFVDTDAEKSKVPPPTGRVKANPETRIPNKVHQATHVAVTASSEGHLILKNAGLDTGIEPSASQQQDVMFVVVLWQQDNG